MLPGLRASEKENRELCRVNEIWRKASAYIRPEASEGSRRRRELAEEGRTIRTRIREVDDQVELLDKLQEEQSDSQTEVQYQTTRLRAFDLFVPKPALADGDVSVCPLCDQGLDHPDETVDELRSLLNALGTRLKASKGVSSRRQSTIERLVACCALGLMEAVMTGRITAYGTEEVPD